MPKPRQWFDVRAAAAPGGEVEIYVYGPIGKCWWDDSATSASGLIEQLDEIKNAHVALHINSLGGDAFEGQAIHNAVKRHLGGVTAYIDGVCASAATFVALGADKVVIAANAVFMIHKAWSWEIGNADEMRGTAAILDKIDLAQTAVYAAKTGMSRDELLAIMADKDNTASGWYTAEEALEAGFVDQVGDEVEAPALQTRDFAASGIRAVPDRFAASLGIAPGSVHGEGRRNAASDEETLREAQQMLIDAHDKIGSVLDAEDAGDGEDGGEAESADTSRTVGAEVAALL